MPGASGAQRLSVSLILDDASTGATPEFAASVEFRKKSIKKRVHEEYYETYITEQIRLAKLRFEEEERLSKRAAEAEAKLLAELEKGNRSKKNSEGKKK